MPGETRLVACLWVIFVVRGLFYAAFIPLWEGFDEWAHYAVIQRLALGKQLLVARGERVSREVDASLQLAPSIYGSLSRDTYWQLPESQRADYERNLRSIPVAWAGEPAIGGHPAYEGQQAPLYYWVFAGAYRLMAGLPFLTRVWLLRFSSLLVASSAVPASFLLARGIFGSAARAVETAAMVAAIPQLMMTVTHIGNDSLAVAIGSWLLVALFWWKELPESGPRAATLGIVVGLALLTKAYLLAFLPPLGILVGLLAVRRKGVIRQALVLVICAGILSGWWYVRTWVLTHSLSGDQVEMAGNRAGTGFVRAAREMRWGPALDFTFLSHVWLGNWSFLVVRSWMYRFFAVLAGLAALGLISRLKRHGLLLLTGIYLSFVAGLGYHAVRTYQASGTLGTLGYYLFPVVAVEVILVTAGLKAIAPSVLRPAVVPGGVFGLLALEFFGVHFCAIPYYTGLIARLPGGGLPALHIAQIRGGGLWLMAERLSVDKPQFLSPAAIAIVWILFLAATVSLMALACAMARKQPERPRSPEADWGAIGP